MRFLLEGSWVSLPTLLKTWRPWVGKFLRLKVVPYSWSSAKSSLFFSVNLKLLPRFWIFSSPVKIIFSHSLQGFMFLQSCFPQTVLTLQISGCIVFFNSTVPVGPCDGVIIIIFFLRAFSKSSLFLSRCLPEIFTGWRNNSPCNRRHSKFGSRLIC